jgi:DNA modification methylase
MIHEFLNPKLNSHKRPSWYNYYAGYSDGFVLDVLEKLSANTQEVVLDPWNGSGTTTQVAEDAGFYAIGFDINPVMVIVSRGRRLDADVYESLGGISKDIISKAEKFRKNIVLENDPLAVWMTEDTVAFIRNIERAIQMLLLDKEYVPIVSFSQFSQINSLVSLFYTALFQVLRELLLTFRTSNPTWIKEPSHDGEKVSAFQSDINSSFRTAVRIAAKLLRDRLIKPDITDRRAATIRSASSDSLPLCNSVVDIVLTSPPYCTRIDYAIATKPELCLLGYSKQHIELLRHSMIGTTTISGGASDVSSDWGKSCLSFLDAVKSHPSRASDTYYYKNYLQYFAGMHNSLREINRVLKSGGKCVIVVQDSYYKDIHNDLPRILLEMGCYFGWNVLQRQNFSVERNMAGINRRSRQYRRSTSAVESILVLRKP